MDAKTQSEIESTNDYNVPAFDATVYHRKFATEDGDRHEVGADLGMGYEWAVDHDADPVDAFPGAYDKAGTVTVTTHDVPAGGDRIEGETLAGIVYGMWEAGEQRDPTEVRSMAVGDIIVIGDGAFFVDPIGFEQVGIEIPDDVVDGGRLYDADPRCDVCGESTGDRVGDYCSTACALEGRTGDDDDDDGDDSTDRFEDGDIIVIGDKAFSVDRIGDEKVGIEIPDDDDGDDSTDGFEDGDRIEIDGTDGRTDESVTIRGDVTNVTDAAVRFTTDGVSWYYQPASGEAYEHNGPGVVRVDDATTVDDEDDRRVAEAFGVDTDAVDPDDYPEPPERVDVGDYKTAAGAAKKTHEALREWADYMGYNPDGVTLHDPDETNEIRDVAGRAWCVSWEGGPYEWSNALSGGEALTAFAGAKIEYGTTPEITGFVDATEWHVECYYSFDLLFYNA